MAARGPKVARRRHSRLPRPPRRKGVFTDLDETLAELRIEISEIRDLGERIVAIGHLRGRGKQSGAEVESSIGYVVEFKNGKVIRMDDYFDPEDALEAAGLSE